MITEPEHITPQFLGEVLACRVDSIDGIERIGTGQMSRNYRLRLQGDGPASIVLKVPAAEPEVRQLGAGAYQREVWFYADVAGRIDRGVARCHHHEIIDDGTEFLLVLDDLAPAEQGDQLAGCDADEARRALSNLAGIHAAAWNDDDVLAGRTFERGDASLLDTLYPMACDEFVARYADRLAEGTQAVLDAFRTKAGSWSAVPPAVRSIVHGDYRLDNLLFTHDQVIAVDWQTVAAGSPAKDVAYFLGNSLTIDDRRRHESELLDAYLDALAERGVDHGRDRLLADYARGAWLGPLVTVVGAFVATRTDRGDDMFIAMADRAAAQILDHDSLARL